MHFRSAKFSTENPEGDGTQENSEAASFARVSTDGAPMREESTIAIEVQQLADTSEEASQRE